MKILQLSDSESGNFYLEVQQSEIRSYGRLEIRTDDETGIVLDLDSFKLQRLAEYCLKLARKLRD